MHITSTDGAVLLTHDGVTYEPVQGYVFEVSQEFGEYLCQFPAWRVTEQDDLGGLDLSELANPVEKAPRVRRPRTPRKTTVTKPAAKAAKKT